MKNYAAWVRTKSRFQSCDHPHHYTSSPVFYRPIWRQRAIPRMFFVLFLTQFPSIYKTSVVGALSEGLKAEVMYVIEGMKFRIFLTSDTVPRNDARDGIWLVSIWSTRCYVWRQKATKLFTCNHLHNWSLKCRSWASDYSMETHGFLTPDMASKNDARHGIVSFRVGTTRCHVWHRFFEAMFGFKKLTNFVPVINFPTLANVASTLASEPSSTSNPTHRKEKQASSIMSGSSMEGLKAEIEQVIAAWRHKF